MVNLLVAAALAAASPAIPSATEPVDEPAMFVVRDADTTVYIFGTFHALDGRSQWFGNQVRTAFEQSDELVLDWIKLQDAEAWHRYATTFNWDNGSEIAQWRTT